jgi:hypothetical protein
LCFGEFREVDLKFFWFAFFAAKAGDVNPDVADFVAA